MNFTNFLFVCPHCRAKLNELNAETLKLRTVRKNGDEGIIELSTKFGDYQHQHIPKTTFQPKEIVDFYCMNCDRDLTSDDHPKYALLNLVVENNISFDIIFSREFGKRKTYVITENGIETYQG